MSAAYAEPLDVADLTPVATPTCRYCTGFAVPLRAGTAPPETPEDAWRIPCCVSVPSRPGFDDWWLWCRQSGRLHAQLAVRDMDRRRERLPVAVERRRA